jgi:tyrosinase
MYKNHRYWDWTLDASDLAVSPVWDATNGFGGNGDPTLDDCVTDGPFVNLTRHWQSKSNGNGYDILRSPHCLQRRFRTGEKKVSSQDRVRDAVIAEILSQRTYEEFFKKLEVRIHNAIPQFIMGDFHLMTAPNGMSNDSIRMVRTLNYC